MKKLILSLGLAAALFGFTGTARADHWDRHHHDYYGHRWHGYYGGYRGYYPGYYYSRPYVVPYSSYYYAPYEYSYAYPYSVTPGVTFGYYGPRVGVGFGVYP